jgi:hypothetical protein
MRIRGLRLRIQLCALAGPAPSLAARRDVLKGADAVVFVADSEADAMVANEQSLDTLQRTLKGKKGELVAPLVIQYNKRDLSTALPVEMLAKKLNPRGVPSFSAIALQGIGVDETLRVITRLCFRSLQSLHEGTGEAASLVPKPTADVGARRDTLPASAIGEPPVPPVRPRVPTHQSLAGKSLATPPPEPDPNRSATVRFTRHEILEKLRTAAEPPAAETPQKPPPPTPPVKKG